MTRFPTIISSSGRGDGSQGWETVEDPITLLTKQKTQPLITGYQEVSVPKVATTALETTKMSWRIQSSWTQGQHTELTGFLLTNYVSLMWLFDFKYPTNGNELTRSCLAEVLGGMDLFVKRVITVCKWIGCSYGTWGWSGWEQCVFFVQQGRQ